MTQNQRKILKEILDLDPKADDFQNLIGSSLATGTSVAEFSSRFVQ